MTPELAIYAGAYLAEMLFRHPTAEVSVTTPSGPQWSVVFRTQLGCCAWSRCINAEYLATGTEPPGRVAWRDARRDGRRLPHAGPVSP